MTVFGWDASHHDWGRGPMDLDAARADGMVYLSHKASEGSTYVDPRFDDAMARFAQMRDPFPLVSAYHVLRTSVAVDREVAHLVEVCEQGAPWWRDHPGWWWMLDCERWPKSGGGWWPAPNVDRINAAGDLLVQATGRRVAAYAPDWCYPNNALRGLRYPLVSSEYGSNRAVPYRQAYPGDDSARWAEYGGGRVELLQFGSQVRIGRQSTCDINAYRGSLDDLKRLLLPTPPPQEDDDMSPEQDRLLKNVERILTCWSTGRVPFGIKYSPDGKDEPGQRDPLSEILAGLEQLGYTSPDDNARKVIDALIAAGHLTPEQIPVVGPVILAALVGS